jgi:hypothetical protein
VDRDRRVLSKVNTTIVNRIDFNTYVRRYSSMDKLREPAVVALRNFGQVSVYSDYSSLATKSDWGLDRIRVAYEGPNSELG